MYWLYIGIFLSQLGNFSNHWKVFFDKLQKEPEKKDIEQGVT